MSAEQSGWSETPPCITACDICLIGKIERLATIRQHYPGKSVRGNPDAPFFVDYCDSCYESRVTFEAALDPPEMEPDTGIFGDY